MSVSVMEGRTALGYNRVQMAISSKDEGSGQRRDDAGSQSFPSIFWDWELATGTVTWGSAIRELGPDARLAPRDRSWWQDRIHPDDRAAVEQAVARAIDQTDARFDLLYRVRGPSDTWVRVLDRFFVVPLNGAAHRLVGVIQPASELLDAPPRVPSSEIEFESFVQSLPLLAWETDPNGWIYYYNERWYEYTQTTFEEMEGWGWVRVHDPLDLPRMLRVFREAVTSGEPWEDEFRLRRGSDGALRWHLSRAVPIRDESGRVVRWFGTNTDIHDQKLALEERERLLQIEQRLRHDAERASREKDEFLAVVSHELRTPLAAIVGWTQALRSTFSDPQLLGPIDRIERNTIALSRLIDDLLDVSRIISGKLEMETSVVDAREALDGALDAVRSLAGGTQIAFRVERPTEPTPVFGNLQRLEQVATNLLTNAIKFSAPGGRVEVSLAREPDHVVLTVRDFGYGIDPALMPKLFERFRQGDASSTRRHGGLGLGLSIVKHLVGLHEGSVTAQSEGPGHGALFTVRLPHPASGSVVAAPATITRSSLVGTRILAVDDDSETRDALAALLLSCGATVTTTGSVADALRALKAGSFDVVISDISMPEIDGYGLVQRIRADARLKDLPVLALTALAAEQDRVRALASGFDAYLPKPVDAARLSHAVAELVRIRSIPV